MRFKGRKWASPFFIISLAIAGIFGASTIIISNKVQENIVVEKAEAASASSYPSNSTGYYTVYLDCSSFSDYDNEQSIAIHYWGSGVDTRKEATKIADNYWRVDVPTSNVTNWQFLRCDTGKPTTTGYNWQNETNDKNNRVYSVTGWNNSGSWSSPNGVTEPYVIASTTPSTGTKRVWLDPKDNFYDSDARAALRVFNGTTHIMTYILGGSAQYASIGDQAYIFYVDINVNYDCQLIRMHNMFNYVWSYGANASTIENYSTTKIIYSWDASASCSAGNEETANVDYAKKVLDGYSTCLSSDVNGYGAWNNINTDVLGKLSSTDTNTLRSSTFTDTTYGTRTYGEKIDRLSNGGKPKGAIRSFSPFIMMGELEDTFPTIIIIVASSVSLLSITTLSVLLVRKRKRNEQ